MSWFLLKTRYRPLHFVAVAVCLLGVGAMVGADILAGRDQGSSRNTYCIIYIYMWSAETSQVIENNQTVGSYKLLLIISLPVPLSLRAASDVVLGDSLVLLSAVLYAVSNMCQEFTVKNLSRVEFLGMMGLFGTIISGIQLYVVVQMLQINFFVSFLCDHLWWLCCSQRKSSIKPRTVWTSELKSNSFHHCPGTNSNLPKVNINSHQIYNVVSLFSSSCPRTYLEKNKKRGELAAFTPTCLHNSEELLIPV